MRMRQAHGDCRRPLSALKHGESARGLGRGAESLESHSIRWYGLAPTLGHDHDLLEGSEVGIRESPDPDVRVARGEELGRGRERGVGNDEEERSAGSERVGEAREKALLESSVLAVGVVRWIEKDDGRPWARSDAEGQRVAAGRAVPGGSKLKC